jgi:hypothetical protein
MIHLPHFLSPSNSCSRNVDAGLLAAGSEGSDPLAVGVSGPFGKCGATGHYIRVRHPALGGPELPATGVGLFASGFCGVRGQWRGPSAGRWAPDGVLRGVDGAGQLVGFALAREMAR